MAFKWSYSGDPSASPEDAVRFLAGDTVPARPLLDDREVTWAVSKYSSNEKLAAALCCDALASRFAGEADVRIGDISKTMSKIADAYRIRAQSLRDDASKMVSPSAPAIFIDNKRNYDEDCSMVQPAFRVGLADNPFAAQINRTLDGVGCFNGFGC